MILKQDAFIIINLYYQWEEQNMSRVFSFKYHELHNNKQWQRANRPIMDF